MRTQSAPRQAPEHVGADSALEKGGQVGTKVDEWCLSWSSALLVPAGEVGFHPCRSNEDTEELNLKHPPPPED